MRLTMFSHRTYCKDMEPLNKYTNTEFLVMFNDYIDRRTPNDPECEYKRVLTLYLLHIWIELSPLIPIYL